LAGAAILTAGGLVGGLALTAVPAYADITTSTYTIGTPSAPVSGVAATPTGVTADAHTSFEIVFTVGTALVGSSSDSVTVVPSTSLGSAPTSVALTGSSCVQATTNGGPSGASSITINLTASCSLSSGSQAHVLVDANAPVSAGSFTFAVTTSKNSSPGTSNSISVTTSGAPVLTAASYTSGETTLYTVNNVPVANLSSSATSLALTATATTGAETIAFVSNNDSYKVSVTPSGGSATDDAVTNASAVGPAVTLTLANALVDGDTLTVTATGTNPAPSASTEADHITVQPGNGTQEVTNSITFGGSVSSVAVATSNPVAGAVSTYTVSFKSTDAVSAVGDIFLTENEGPTNFSGAGIEVTDTTHPWEFVASGAILASGSATVPLQDAITAGDNISMILVGVTNPSSAGAIGDFSVATSGDPVAVNAPPYTIAVNASPGVVVTVNPSATGAIATYTISDVHASAALTGGSGTIKVEAPPGTVFPSNPSDYQVTDSTTSSGSGTVSAGVTGGATDTVTFTVPNTINSGDVFSLTLQDVLNPGTASSTDSITLVGNVTGPLPVAATTTTTTTTVPTTTTTTRPPKPAVTDLTTKANVVKGVVGVKIKCTGAKCAGTVTLTDVTTVVATAKYSERVGKTNTFAVYLKVVGNKLLAGAKDHTIKVTATVTVTGGTTIKQKTTLVG
jgi:hypothetical protein